MVANAQILGKAAVGPHMAIGSRATSLLQQFTGILEGLAQADDSRENEFQHEDCRFCNDKPDKQTWNCKCKVERQKAHRAHPKDD